MQIRKTRQQSRGGDDALRALWVHLRFKLKFQFITTANITHTQSRYFDSCLLDLLAFLLFTCFSQFDQCANTKCLCCCCSLLSSDLARLCPSVPIKTWTCQQKFTHTHTQTASSVWPSHSIAFLALFQRLPDTLFSIWRLSRLIVPVPLPAIIALNSGHVKSLPPSLGLGGAAASFLYAAYCSTHFVRLFPLSVIRPYFSICKDCSFCCWCPLCHSLDCNWKHEIVIWTEIEIGWEGKKETSVKTVFGLILPIFARFQI